MACLSKAGTDYVLNCNQARRSVVGQAEELNRSTELPESAVAALLSPTRTLFVLGLVDAWARSKAVLLAPREGLVERLVEPPGKVTFPDNEVVSKPPGVRVFHPSDVVCTVLTSGSTGQPALFEKTAWQIFEEAFTISDLLEMSGKSTVLATTAPHHLYGLLFSIIAPWVGGSSIVAHEGNEPAAFHPAHVASLCAEFQVTHLVTVPAHLRALLEAPVTLPGLTHVSSSAAPLEPEHACAFEEKFGARVLDVLGSTETGGIAYRNPVRSRTYTPLPGVSIALDESERLLIQSRYAAVPHERMRSHERALIHPDGSFEYLGRSDSVVKVGGKRIDLGEVEKVARTFPGVSGVVALGRPVRGLRGQEILLVVAGRHVDKASLKRFLRNNLEGLFVPRKIRVVEALPHDERGKLKRDDLVGLFDPQPKADVFESEVLLSADSRRFQGHFEGDPLLPALAQLSDIILPAIRKSFGGGALLELSRVKWTHPLRPGARVRLRLEPTERGIRFEIFEGTALACSGMARLDSKSGGPR